MRRIRLLALLLVMLAALASACTPIFGHPALVLPAGTNAGGSAASSGPVLSADFPRGRFSAISYPNMMVLVIENDGQYRVFLDGALMDSGGFSMASAQVRVDSVKCAAEQIGPALYAWGYDEDQTLAFQPVASDMCSVRRQYLAEVYQPKYLFVLHIPDGGPSSEWLW